MRFKLFSWFLLALALSITGCQAWSQMGQNIPTGSRVPAPGTGTYQVPSSYYNNGAKTGTVGSTVNPSAPFKRPVPVSRTTTRQV